MKNYGNMKLALVLMILSALGGPVFGSDLGNDFSKLPVQGMITMIDLGAKACVPCKMMAPIMEKMEKRYEGKAAIVFIDVRKHRAQGLRFGIRTIPTQIFFDADAREVYRHVGFMSEKAIVHQLNQMGVP